MKRVLFSITATVVGLVALLDFKSHGKPLAAPPGGLPSVSASTPAGAAPPPTRSSGGATRAPAGSQRSASHGAGAPKQYAGAPVQTRYGVVQVALTATGTHIDSVRFLQLTAYDGHSQQINSFAGPILLQETVKAQSAHIDTVSGATYTSEGYLQSLQSALDQANIR
jgi:uncharacterized protein with FMN-binding domain